MRHTPRFHRLCLALGLAASLASAQARGGANAVTGAHVNRAIARGVAQLKQLQRPDGTWSYSRPQYTPGATALAVLALVSAGTPVDDRAVRTGVRYIAQAGLDNTYSVALTAMALAAVDAKGYTANIAACRDWLLFAQQPSGAWGYTRGRGQRTDNSNTQFAVLGLRAAQEAGCPAPEEAWDAVEKYFRGNQSRDGGWGYRGASSYGSMTAAGLGSLIICGAQVQREIKWCGQHTYDADVVAGLKWFDRQFSIERNPGKNSWHYYYLYAVERVGVLSARRYIGGHDWYREGAYYLVKTQRPDGGWGSSAPDTCFGLLFLAKGKAPVLVQKLRRAQDWNNDPNDVRNLCAFFGEAVGQKVSWQITRLSAPLEDLRAAPVLYFSGHKALQFGDAEVEKLREFVTQGGFIFAEACCGRREFDRSFRAVMGRVFPQRDLTKLSSQHPVYRSFFNIAPGERSALWGLRASCRTSVMYSATDLSCKWEKKQINHPAFKIGVNVLAYATGLEPLRDKLDKVEVIHPTKSGPLPRGAFLLAQVKHSGDWEPDTRAAEGFLRSMSRNVNMDVGSDKAPVALSNEDLFDYPVLYLVGHFPLRFAPEEKRRLKLYLERGGFLLAESCCGVQTFDKSFRSLMAELFPGQALKRLLLDHPVFATGFRIRRVQYKRAVLKDTPKFDEPWLEALMTNGRVSVIYSKFSMGCAWENHPCQGCKGLERDDALKLGSNIILYGLTH